MLVNDHLPIRFGNTSRLPAIPHVVSDHAQPEAHLVRPEAAATQPRHLHRLLAFFVPLFRRPPPPTILRILLLRFIFPSV
jgi:hypothetical protein